MINEGGETITLEKVRIIQGLTHEVDQQIVNGGNAAN